MNLISYIAEQIEQRDGADAGKKEPPREMAKRLYEKMVEEMRPSTLEHMRLLIDQKPACGDCGTL